MKQIFPRILLASLTVTLAVWLGWSLGGLVALRLAPGFYPVLAGLLSAVPVGALYWFSPSSLMLSGYGVVIAVVGAACLSMPGIWRRAGG